MSYILDALRKSEKDRKQQEIDVPERDIVYIDDASGNRGIEKYKYMAAVVVLVLLGSVYMLWGLSSTGLEPMAPQNLIKPITTKPNSAVDVASAGRPAEPASVQVTKAVEQPRRYRDLPFIWELPSEIKQNIDKLVVTIHVYSPKKSQRTLFINNSEYRAGDETREGARVEEIVPEGVILSAYGTRFRLPRPR